MNESNYDILIYKGGQTDEQWERLVENVASLETVTDFNDMDIIHSYTWFDKT